MKASGSFENNIYSKFLGDKKMKRINREIISDVRDYWKKHIRTPFLTFLSSKLAGIDSEKMKEIGKYEDKEFLKKFMTVDGKYYNPCEDSHPKQNYYTTIHKYRHRSTMRYSAAFEKISKGLYKFSKDYIAHTKSHAMIGKIYLSQIVFWLYRDEIFAEADNAEFLKRKFISEFNINGEELEQLFYDDLNDQSDIFEELFPKIPVSSTDDKEGLAAFSTIAFDIKEPAEPNRTSYVISRIIRDTQLSHHVKELYNFTCQICRKSIELKNGQKYAEAHHLKPLGHLGPDISSNIICVCPDDHVRLDFGSIKLNKADLFIKPSHEIKDEYIDYHNSIICV